MDNLTRATNAFIGEFGNDELMTLKMFKLILLVRDKFDREDADIKAQQDADLVNMDDDFRLYQRNTDDDKENTSFIKSTV